jgi:hypothetical protein
MTTFINNASVNKSGLTTTDMQTLINQLNIHRTTPGRWWSICKWMVSGTAVMGPVSGGAVVAFAVNNGIMGAQLASGLRTPWQFHHADWRLRRARHAADKRRNVYGFGIRHYDDHVLG